MCGILGYLAANSSSPDEGATLRQRMTAGIDALRRRGPDGSEIWIEGNQRGRVPASAGLAHSRLAVNGGRSASQPIVSDDGRLVVVVNGELYDPDDQLRRRLIGRGCQFRSSGDAELVLHLYRQYGKEFTTHLRGEFAILIYDSRAREMVAVRDRFGIKPIVYAVTPNGDWWWASQPQALFAVGLDKAIDEESFWHSMSFQYTLPDRTLFRGVRQVLPGQMMTVRQTGESTIAQTETYWDLDYPTEPDAHLSQTSPAELADELRHRLGEATIMRTRGDVPVVAHLSGGIDSCSVLNLATSGRIARAFTVRFPSGDQYDELEKARLVADQHHVELSIVTADWRAMIDALPNAVSACGGLAANGHLSAKYLLNTAISEAGFKVALTGEGGDELLAGYPHLRIDHCYAIGRPDLVDSIIGGNSASRGVMLPSDEGFGGQAIDFSAIEQTLGYVPTFLRAKASLGRLLRSHLRDDFTESFAGRDAYQELMDAIAKPSQLAGRDRVWQSIYLWSKTALAQNILRTLGDGCESSQAVEGRLPMLDHHLFDWCKRLPIQSLIALTESSKSDAGASSGLTEKWLLRQAMKTRLPGVIVNTPKHPFIAPPLATAFASDSDLRDRIVSAAHSHRFFDSEKVCGTLKRVTAKSIEDPHNNELVTSDPLWWTLLSSELLMNQVMDNRSS